MIEMPTAANPVVLICGDSLKVLSEIECGSVDAVIMDPPYGINYTTGFSPSCSWHESPIHGDDSTDSRDAILRWAHQHQLPFACFGSWKSIPPENTRGALVWNKGPAFGMGDLSFPWKPSWELIFVGGNGWTGKRDEGVLSGPCVVSWESSGRLHPTQKPVWLVANLLAKLPTSAVILDPFLGSGTTAIACLQTGRRCIGIEIDPHYHAIAQKRVADYMSAGPMFAAIEQGRLFDTIEDHP